MVSNAQYPSPTFNNLAILGGLTGAADAATASGTPLSQVATQAAAIPGIQTQLGTLNGAVAPIPGMQTQIGTLTSAVSPIPGMQTQIGTLNQQVTTFATSSDLAQVKPGRLLAVRAFSSSGTYTPTSGTNSIIVEMVSGGGGGGGASPTSDTTKFSAASGGQAGGYARFQMTSGFSGAAVTVGAAGVGGAIGQAGTSGGYTQFGSYVLAGGQAGVAGQILTPPAVSVSTIPNGQTNTFGPTILTQGGASPSYWIALSATNGAASRGGDSMFGRGGVMPAGQNGGSGGAGAAYGFGAGGAGAWTPGTYSQGLTGAPGAPGYIIVYEYS